MIRDLAQELRAVQRAWPRRYVLGIKRRMRTIYYAAKLNVALALYDAATFAQRKALSVACVADLRLRPWSMPAGNAANLDARRAYAQPWKQAAKMLEPDGGVPTSLLSTNSLEAPCVSSQGFWSMKMTEDDDAEAR
jgi:hypothetical protein